MKVLVLLLVFMMVSACLASSRRAALGGIYGQEQRNRFERGKAILEGDLEEKMSGVVNQARSVNNHHSIPRQHYNDKGGSPQGNDPDNGSETGQP